MVVKNHHRFAFNSLLLVQKNNYEQKVLHKWLKKVGGLMMSVGYGFWVSPVLIENCNHHLFYVPLVVGAHIIIIIIMHRPIGDY